MYPFGPFSLTIDFDGLQAVISVRGDLDAQTAPTLDGLVSALIAESHLDLIFDLSNSTFVGAAALSILAKSAQLVEPGRGAITVRSTNPSLARMLEMTGLQQLLSYEPIPAAAAQRLSAVGQDVELADEGEVPPLPEEAPAMKRVRPWFADDHQVEDALQLVSTLAQATVHGANGVSVSLKRNGTLSTVAATNDTILHMDAHQYTTGEGPCVAAAENGKWFYCRSVADELRWPKFTPLARDEGISSILSTGVVVDGRPIGALNIYSNKTEAFGGQQQELAALFAVQAAGILVDGISDATLAETNLRISTALFARELIAQAVGVLMSRGNMSADDATKTLHRAARAAEQTVLHYATEVVASTIRRST